MYERILNQEGGVGTICHVKQHNYLGVMKTDNGNHEAGINNRINKGRAYIKTK